MDDPCFPFETLPSPVMDDKKDEFVDDIGGEMLKVSFENWLAIVISPHFCATGQGFVKSSARNAGAGFTGGDTGAKFRSVVTGAEKDGVAGGARLAAPAEEGADEAAVAAPPLRNRAWPVRFSKEMTFLNLVTVKSAISLQSTWLCRAGPESWKTRCSMLRMPAAAAS